MVFHQHQHTALFLRRVLAPMTSSEEMGKDRVRDSTMTGNESLRRKIVHNF